MMFSDQYEDQRKHLEQIRELKLITEVAAMTTGTPVTPTILTKLLLE